MSKERQVRSERSSGSNDGDLLAIFMREITRLPVLTRAEESTLIVRAAAGDKAAEDRLVASSLRFVVKVALSQWRALNSRYPGLSPMDLIQEASINLVRSVRKLNPAFGCRVLTYATPGIRQGIARVIVDYKRHQCDSLDETIPGYDDETLLDRLPSEGETADATAYHAEIVGLLERLKAREKTILNEHFLKGKPLSEIARILRTTKEAIRRTETKALFRLRWAVEHGEPLFAKRQRER